MSTEGEHFERAISMADMPESGITAVMLNGWRVLLARVGESFCALNDRCSHAASPLSTGRMRHGTIMCPLHGARFELATGKSIGGANRPVRSFAVRVVDGWIEVAVPDARPGLSEIPVLPD